MEVVGGVAIFLVLFHGSGLWCGNVSSSIPWKWLVAWQCIQIMEVVGGVTMFQDCPNPDFSLSATRLNNV